MIFQWLYLYVYRSYTQLIFPLDFTFFIIIDAGRDYTLRTLPEYSNNTCNVVNEKYDDYGYFISIGI